MALYSGFPVTRLTTALLVAVLLVPVLGRSSAADEHDQHGYDGNEHNQHGHGGNEHNQHGHGGNEHYQYWHGGNEHYQYGHGDTRRFHEQDMEYWRRGHWYHGGHEGRAGWWWIVGGTWYFYPVPVYPYPNPYRPPVVVVSPAPRPVTPHYWYYCPNPPGYYPYVPQCLTGWQPVPAVP